MPSSESQRVSTRQTEMEQNNKGSLEESSRCCLDLFFSMLAATVWEDALITLNILANGNTTMVLTRTLNNFNKLREKTFSVAPSMLETEQKSESNTDMAINLKLDADLTFVRESHIATYLDLGLNKSYKTLDNMLGKMSAQTQYLKQLSADVARNKLRCHELRLQAILLQKKHLKELNKQEARISALLDEISCLNERSAIQYRYVSHWEKSRQEQIKLTVSRVQDKSVLINNYYRNCYIDEERAHLETEHYYDILHREKSSQIEKFAEKYDHDTEAMNLKLQFNYNVFDDLQSYRKLLERKLMKRNQEIFEWNQFKADREVQREYAKKMTHSAIIVQAWWRGILCRQHLGPYRPKSHRGRR
ncbi:dynein regulatory complex protein 9-like isoform X2 [Hyposmocoma kahamanoa]|uniref:dynein regulatory complex protein 9-like isoform X2 n=1 Tax=Hyposmocoma kahamanoa TaxID=1477025 RepID=UPI000E6D72B9|nr:dynein regulatory complex protein 9-like isoform X2 [Hyposmocoma kahamanoa]